ncbi:MAG: hypothetical protein K8T89_02095, partial [Planctomycetes bacterium]|nr:hypothetical protein [Planctomycetota bacterium]
PFAKADDREEVRIKLNRDDKLWRFVKDKESLPVIKNDGNRFEHTLYNDVFIHAQQFSLESLAKHSRKDSVYADLVGDARDQFLRELLHLEGTLVRLRERETTERLKAANFPKLYEGWLVVEDEPTHLIEIVFAELPEGVTPAEKMNQRISFDGYYFKLLKYQYDAKDGKDNWRYAPLLIGRSIKVIPGEISLFSLENPSIPALMIVIGMTIIGSGIVILWLRRGDRKVRAKAQDALTRQNPYPEAQAPPAAVEPGNDWNRLANPPMN